MGTRENNHGIKLYFGLEEKQPFFDTEKKKMV